MSGTSRRTDRSVQLAGIPNAILSTITLAERGEDVTEATMRAQFSTKAQRGETLGRLAAYVETHRRR